MHRATRKRRGEESTGASAALPSKSRKQATKRASADDHIRRTDAIITSFTEITTKLSGAIAPCVNKVAELLHAKDGLIGFKLKDDTINGAGTDADKSGRLVVQLERTLRDEDNPAEFMEKLCLVLKDPSLGERKLVQLADSLHSVLSDDEIDGDDVEQQETTKRKSGKVSTKGLDKQQGSKRKKPDQTKAPSNTKRKRKTDSDVSDEEEHDSDVESGSSDYDTADDDGPDDPKDLTLPQIGNVVKEFKYKQASQLERIYKMNTTPRGYCLIVNISKGRRGSDKDAADLTKVFKKLHFKVEVYPNLTSDQIQQLVTNAKAADHSKLKCFIMVLLAHGEDGEIKDVDGKPVVISELEDHIKECPSLRGKPKLLFIQACRGDCSAQGIEYEVDEEEDDDVEEDEDDVTITAPKETDFLLAYATPRGHKAKRHPDEGSRFIQSLVKVFDEDADHCDIFEMLTKVIKMVAQKKRGKAGRQHVPEFTSRLSKTLYFGRPPDQTVANPDKDEVDAPGSKRNAQKRNGSKAYSLNPFNKMAAKVDGQSSGGPADIFRRTLPSLSTPIGKEPSFTAVTDLLFSKDLITQNVLDGITSQPNLTDKKRGSKVAHALYDKIKASDDPVQCLLKICTVLEDKEVNDELLKKYGASMRNELLSTTTAQQVPAVVNAHVPSLTATVVPHPSSAAAPLQVTPSPSTDTLPPISAGLDVSAVFRRHSADIISAFEEIRIDEAVNELHAANLISKPVYNDVNTTEGITAYKKATRVVRELQRCIDNSQDPRGCFSQACQVLLKLNDAKLSGIVAKMTGTNDTNVYLHM